MEKQNPQGVLVTKLIRKRIANIALAFVLVLIGGITSQSARAADCPYPVADQTANDHPDNVIRLVSPVLTDENSIRRYDFEQQFTIDCDWFGVGMRFNQVYVPFGLRTNLTYHVTDAAGVPKVNTQVTLRANKGYSNSNAAIRVNGIKARPAPSNASDGANVRGMTDMNGNVTFVVNSPDDCTVYGGVLPPAPAHENSDTPNDRNADPTTDCFSQLIPSISGEKTDATDWVELHYFDSSQLDYSGAGGVAVSKLQVPNLNETNSISTSTTIQAYTALAGSQIVSLNFSDQNGFNLRNLPVRVRINTSGSSSNALISSGIVGNSGNGTATVLAQSDPTLSAADQLVLSGLTDAFGNVTFNLVNTDTVGEPRPASLTSPMPTANRKFATIIGQIESKANLGKNLELHFVSGFRFPGQALHAPTDVRASVNGLAVTVSWINDSDNQGLTTNSVYDSDDNLVCTTGLGEFCAFNWDVFGSLKSQQYYVVPSSESSSGPASELSNSVVPIISKPVMYTPGKNWQKFYFI